MSHMVTLHMRVGDVVVLLALAVLFGSALFALAYALRSRPVSTGGKLGKRVATSVVVRRTAGVVNRVARFDRWN